ncbi:MAG: Fic family protein [Flavobacteriia bacterium]|nr:Fic family protein [Flavobacteriia bacterium]
MLSDYLKRFNKALHDFQVKFPRPKWSEEFKRNLVNDFTFFSSRVEDAKLQYGDTIKYLNDQLVRASKLQSLIEVANHKDVLSSVIDRYDSFSLTTQSIKDIHRDLMSVEMAWEVDFKPHLVGEFRNIPTIGFREPVFPNKEYVPHYNVEMAIESHLSLFNNKFENINNEKDESHLITALSYFHNIFLNKIHPFADGNGRVGRIIMGTMLMKNDCPPIFVMITSDEDRHKYISAIIDCEKQNSDLPLIEFLANGMSEYLEAKTKSSN